MISYFKRLLWEEGAFVGMIRTVFGVLGIGIESGHLPVPAGWEWLGLFGVGAAFMLRSSVKTTTTTTTTKSGP